MLLGSPVELVLVGVVGAFRSDEREQTRRGRMDASNKKKVSEFIQLMMLMLREGTLGTVLGTWDEFTVYSLDRIDRVEHCS